MREPKQYKYLFLDRDGVINVERPNDYVKNTSELVFIDGVLESMKILSDRFDYIFIITNQRGVGRNVMSLSDLEEVHTDMLSKIKEYGGNISSIYYCTDTDNTSVNRKPNIGMAFQVKRDYPCVDFSQSVFIGNSKSDIDFANKLGMFAVLVGDKYKKDDKIYNCIDAYYENLYKFVENFTS